MRVEELRIGNFIQCKGQYLKIKGLWHEGNIYAESNVINSGESAFEPIPLTEEILLKCGFKNEFGNDWFIGELHPEIFKREMFIYGNKEGFFYNDFRRKIEYLHDLQNLYFALTGKELQINL